MVSNVREQVAKGYTVEQVDFGSGGEKLGAYFQTGPNAWKETNVQGQTTFQFVEVNRDEWSVYLDDGSRGVSIQIDLHRKKVRYSDPNTPWRDQYDVLRATPVVGWLVEQSDFSGGGKKLGAYFQTGLNAWKEVNTQGQTTFQFAETNRDDWSVYMNDSSRGVSIQIDLHRKKIRYSDSNTPWRDQYDVLSAEPIVGWLVRQAIFGSGADTFGRFRQKAGSNNWEELNAQGQTTFHFTETNRDDWSVYMNDSSRGVLIQIDLHRKKIRYSDPNTPWRDQYDLLYATS